MYGFKASKIPCSPGSIYIAKKVMYSEADFEYAIKQVVLSKEKNKQKIITKLLRKLSKANDAMKLYQLRFNLLFYLS